MKSPAALAGSAALPRLLLVGGGHAHVQVLRRFAMERPAAEVTLVVDRPLAVYSGMVPGFVAGAYRRQELEIDLLPLARRAGARVIFATATRVDAAARRLELDDRPPLAYDLISFNIGASVAGLELPGVREAAIATRPIHRLIDEVERLLERWTAADAPPEPRVVVVGAGSGGIELAFTLEARLRAMGRNPRIQVVQTGLFILPGYSPTFRQKVEEAAARRGIELVLGKKAIAVEQGALKLESGVALPFDALFWVTGAAAPTIFRDSGLLVDERGFLLVRPTLQSPGAEEIFAAGDCATLTEAATIAKAGVYAVRMGPVLESNLRAKLTGRALDAYLPQRNFLSLLNLGDGTAIGGKWGFAFEGSWVMRWKDKIDREFLERFQVLAENDEPAPAFARMESRQGGDGEMAPMYCGGCAAKVGQSSLERALGRLPPAPLFPGIVMGLDRPDDAAAFRTPGGEVVLTSVDAFKAFTGDGWLVGRVAAVNALSDLYAKGARPAHALALVALPEGLAEERGEDLLVEVLAGMRAVFDPLGVALLGGHTTLATELMAGLAVTGFAPAAAAPAAGEAEVEVDDEDAGLLRKGGIQPGQKLILTKALGTGVLLYADPLGLVRGPWLAAAFASMLRPNATAAAIAAEMGATAATDVTGFGLIGHLGEMTRASPFSAALDVDRLPVLPGAVELLSRGYRSSAQAQNEQLLRGTIVDDAAGRHRHFPLLADPQTSGGLLFAAPADRAQEALRRLHQAGDGAAAIVGEVLPGRRDGARIRLRCGPPASSSTTAG